MSFISRQTENLKRLVEVSQLAARVPQRLRTREQKQDIAIEGNPCRCVRCGSRVYPLVAMPAPYLCEICHTELRAADQAAHPGCMWWGELLSKVQARKQASAPEEDR
jgi:hypothetical protein